MTNTKAGPLGVVIALLTIIGGGSAGAENYPTRPIQVIVPFAGGSASDVVTRILLDRTAKSIGQPFIIENRPGAGGNTGTMAAAKATPDGYTLVATGSGPAAVNAISATIRRRTSSRSRWSESSPLSSWRVR